jgi:hypothetical protein
MAAKTGKGYEQHGRRYRVKVLREDGKRRYVSFETEQEAAVFAQRRVGTRALEEILEQSGGPRRIARASRIALETALSGGRETPTVAELGRELVADQTIRPNTRRTYRNSLTRVLQDEGSRTPRSGRSPPAMSGGSSTGWTRTARTCGACSRRPSTLRWTRATSPSRR